MNRIILIGNGFDLAHGLKTSYADFIDWYWNKRILGLRTESSNVTKDILCSLEINPKHYNSWSLYFFLHGHKLRDLTGRGLVSEYSLIILYLKLFILPILYLGNSTNLCANVFRPNYDNSIIDKK